MTYKDKLKQDTGLDVNGAGCPCDHGYEERQGFTVHCTAMTCEECWNREMKEKENENMKYKVGDVVRTTKDRDINGCELFSIGTVGVITDIDEEECCPYVVQAKNDYWNYSEDMLEPFKTYEQGLEDAWELAKKVWTNDDRENQEMFGTLVVKDIFSLAPQEALAKLKAYEEAQEIKVGDVVETTDLVDVFNGVVLDFKDGTDDEVVVFNENGCVDVWRVADCKKTGKHVDIAGLLEQIKGE